MYFDELALSDEVLDALWDMHFDTCTPVQEQTIPVILDGHDVISCAQTGTGKTAAYILPLLTNLQYDNHDPNKLNAIIFYDETGRPNVEVGAFGTESNDYINNTVLPPGKGQYYVFVPYRLGRLGSYRGELYYTTDDLMYDTYWDVLHAIMVDDQPKDDHYQPHRNTESWYLNVTGYDWYKERYYDYITITPPAI
jgi:hypothetical protein